LGRDTAGIVGGCGLLAVAALGGTPLSRRSRHPQPAPRPAAPVPRSSGLNQVY